MVVPLQMTNRDLRVPRQVYRLRVLGLALGFLSVGAVFRELREPAAAWAALAANGFLWPHVAWLHSRLSADPHRAERANLIVDTTLGGVWVALMQFNLLPSVLIVAMLSMDKLGWGTRFVARAVAAMAIGCATAAWATGGAFRPQTTMVEILASIPLMVAYPVAVAFVSNRSGRLERERKEAVEQTAALREQLAHVARVGTLGEMAAGLAHELNQPLTAIHAEANVGLALADAGDVGGMRESLERVGDQALRAGEIVRRMRTYARQGGEPREPIDVHLLIREVLALLEHDLRLGGVLTACEFASAVPPVVVERVAIQQVLVNVIRNAIESMADVPVRRLSIRTETAGAAVRVSVGDTGPGVDPAIAPRLFHPFQTTKPAGLGLGLSICQSLVEAHGGRIGTTAAAGGGAVFFFELPAAAAS